MAKRKWGSPKQRAALKKMLAARRAKHPKQLSLAIESKPTKHRRRKHHRGQTTRTITTSRVVTRRNPGFVGAAKETLFAALPAVAAGAGIGFVDTKILAGRSIIIRVGAKLGAAAVAAMALRSRPKMAFATMGAILGTVGYEGGVRVGGGVIAASKTQGMKELAAMAAEDEQSLGLLQEEMKGMGLLTEMSDMGDQPELEGIGEDQPELQGVGADIPDLGDEENITDMGDEEISDFGDEENY